MTATSTTSSTTGCTTSPTVTLSSFYFDILKDRLYTFPSGPGAPLGPDRVVASWPTGCAV